MTGLPVVIAVPLGSDISKREANVVILNTILTRVQDIAREIDTTANGLRALATRFATPQQCSDDDLANELRNLDASLERLLTLRTALSMRLTAFSNQRRATQAPEADDPFADPTLISKAS